MKNNRVINLFWQNTILVAGIVCPLAIIFLVKFSKIPLGIDWQWPRISSPLVALKNKYNIIAAGFMLLVVKSFVLRTSLMLVIIS